MEEFKEFLYKHFPHRWLNQKAKGTKKLFDGLGKSLEYTWNFADIIRRNNSIKTAEEIITELENEYGIPVNPSYGIEYRRQRILVQIRIQDCPITKIDLLKMLETLGIRECLIQNHYTEYQLEIQFLMEEGVYEKLPDIKRMLNENVRAHILFLLNGYIKEAYKNKEYLDMKKMCITTYIRNLGLQIVRLDGEKTLDGSWYLRTVTKSPRLNSIKITVGMCNLFQISTTLIIDSLWIFDGQYLFDGTKKFSAEIKKELL